MSRFMEGFKYEYISLANLVWLIVGKIPLLNRKYGNGCRYMGPKSRRVAAIIGIIGTFIYEIIKKLIYVAIFLFMPYMLFSKFMPAGSLGFGLDNCFVYFAIVTSAFCGSVLNTTIFDASEESYFMLRQVKMRPKKYMRYRMLRRSVLELVAYTAAISMFGMMPFKAFYIAVIIVLSRYIGEAINILFFSSFGIPFMEVKGGTIVISLVTLFLAYFIPYVRGYVPAAYNIIFSTMWLVVILTAASFFLYFVWNYNNYSPIVYSVNSRSLLIKMYDEGDSNEDMPRMAYDSPRNKRGWWLLNSVFFRRNSRKIVSNVAIRVVSVAAVIGVGFIAKAFGQGALIYKIISYSMPVLLLVMMVFSNGFTICREMYVQCDRFMLRTAYYRDKYAIAENYFVRLVYLTVIDIIPALLLAVGYGFLGYLTNNTSSLRTVISICVSIIMLSVLFSVVNLTLYFLIRPFDEKGRMDSPVYFIMYAAVLLISFLCMNIDARAVDFALVIGILLAVILSLSATVIYVFGKHTFRYKG